MKKLFFILLILAMAPIVNASPYIVCDPYTDPGSMPDSFVVKFNGGGEEIIPYQMHIDGDAAIIYDLEGIMPGEYTIEVKARNIAGDSETVSWTFFLMSPPAKPTNVYLKP